MNIINVPRRFTASAWGGTETVILKTSQQLNRSGHKSQIFTTTALDANSQETMDNIPVRRFAYNYPFFGLTSADIAELDRKGGNLLSLPLLWGLLREPDVNILHAHSGKRLGGVVRTAARMRSIPYVVTLHGGIFDVPAVEQQRLTEPLNGAFEWGRVMGALLGSRSVLDDAAAIICVGANEAQAAQKALPNKRIEYIPNGVDVDAFKQGNGDAFRAKFGIPSDARIILCVSRIDYQKNQIGLVEALPTILEADQNTHIVLVGPVTIPQYNQKLQKRIEQLGVSEKVTVIPGLKPDDPMLSNAFHAAEIFCLPSLHEPFGIVILEAWAAGLPVAAANVGGVPSFTTDGEDIIHFDSQHPKRIAAALVQLLENPEQKKFIAANGKRKAQTQYSWSIIGEQMLHLYEDLVR